MSRFNRIQGFEAMTIQARAQHHQPLAGDIDNRHHLHPFTDTKELVDRGRRQPHRHQGRGRLVGGLRGPAAPWTAWPGSGASTSATAASELAEAAYRQMLELPYYNTFFQTRDAAARWSCRRSWRS